MLNLPLLLLLAPLSVLAHPALSPRSGPTVRSIYEFSDFRMENLAPRSNGHLLLTASNQPFLYDIDPTASSPSPSKLPSIPGVLSVLGIAEISPDVFAVAAGNYSSSMVPTTGSFGIWQVDMTQAEPTVKLITQIPTAEGLNGMAALNGFSGTILVADTILGAVYKVDVSTGAYSIAIQNDDFAPVAGHTPAFGINGLRMSGGDLYFTNSAQGLFGRVPVNGEGAAEGDVQILARLETSAGTYDDLDLDCEGNSWIATHTDMVLTVTTGGTQSNMTGGTTPFLQPTSARFGRGGEAGVLYVADYGSAEVFGQLVAVDGLSSVVSGGGFACA